MLPKQHKQSNSSFQAKKKSPYYIKLKPLFTLVNKYGRMFPRLYTGLKMLEVIGLCCRQRESSNEKRVCGGVGSEEGCVLCVACVWCGVR